MIDTLHALVAAAEKDILSVSDAAALESIRVKYLGKKGELSQILRGMGGLSAEERPRVGQLANEVKAKIEKLISDGQTAAQGRKLEEELRGPRIDVTLPGRRQALGHRHPVSRALDDIVNIFRRMAFDVAEGPEIELDYYNFEALNIPKDHPARDMQATFFVDEKSLGEGAPAGGVVLRTHTSPVQIRTMLSRRPPIRIISPGRVYRCDSDLTHTAMFHQLECLMVDRGVSFAHLKGTIDAFMKGFFGEGTKTRLRPSYFPFVEPGAEMDVSCVLCAGKGCRACKNTGWLEIGGAGMVHPAVFEAVGYDPEEFTGFAFGFGIDRMALLRHGIDDLRSLFENDARFLRQF
jgi:phenylalanyl-tRNA synthetase alpha chain